MNFDTRFLSKKERIYTSYRHLIRDIKKLGNEQILREHVSRMGTKDFIQIEIGGVNYYAHLILQQTLC